MKRCPKCGRKLHIYNWRPNCPDCGVNIMFAGYEQQFAKDRRITEMTIARTKIHYIKFKCSFFGSVLAKVRIPLALLPIVGLLFSFGAFTVSTPIYEKVMSFNLMGMLDANSAGYLLNLGAYSGGPVLGESLSALAPALYAYLAVAAFAVLVLLSELLCFINFKAISMAMSVIGALGVLASTVTEVLLYRLSGISSAVCSMSMGAGFFIQVISFIPVIVISLMLAKKGVEYNISQGDELRLSYYRKYKKGEIDIMDIPAPIYLSEDEKAEKDRLTRELFNAQDEKKEESQNV